MRLAALMSGGKDSLYAAYLAQKDGNEIVCAIVMVPKSDESYMFHFPNARLVRKQAAQMNIPLIEKQTEGIKERELDDLQDAIESVRGDIDGVVAGALASSYQKLRIDSICKRLGLLSIAPLWQCDPVKYLKKAISEFEIIITAVAAPPLDEKWLGRRLDGKCVDELAALHKRFGIHPGGEGGEFESFVLDCPMFAKRIKIADAEKHWDAKSRSGYYEIKKIELEDKI